MKSTFIAIALAAGSLLIGTQAQAAPIAGGINADGTKQVTTSAYTVKHPSRGRYVITFSTAWSPYWTCTYTPVGHVYLTGLIEKSRSCDVTFADSTGALTNTLFNFVADQTTN